MPRTLPPLFALAALLAGCAAAPMPKYAVGLPVADPVPVPAARLELRMAEDLRAYANPLILRPGGIVAPCRTLAYYAPVELALARALRDASRFEGKDILRLTVLDFHADLRGEVPLARVTLSDGQGRTVSQTEPLPADWTAPLLRDALGRLLLQAYAALTAHAPTP